MVKKGRVGKKGKGKKLKRRSKLLVYEERQEKNRYMAFLNICVFSASVAVAGRLMLSLHTHC